MQGFAGQPVHRLLDGHKRRTGLLCVVDVAQESQSEVVERHVTQVRARIATVPLAQRVYSRIRPSAAAQRVPAWRPGDVLGVAGATLFMRSSGKPLTDGVPGFLTTEGLQQLAYNGQPMVTSIGIVGTPQHIPDGYQILDRAAGVNDLLRPMKVAGSAITMVAILLWIIAVLIV